MTRVTVPATCLDTASPEELQAAADAGHFAWRVDPQQVVLSCLRRSLGTAQWSVRTSAPGRIEVRGPVTDLHARFTLTQPDRRGSGGIWQISSVRADRPLTLPPACAQIQDPRLVSELLTAHAAGHQPWRADPVQVVQACVAAAFAGTGIHARLTGPDTYTVTADDRWSAGGQIEWRTGLDVRLPFLTSLEVANPDA